MASSGPNSPSNIQTSAGWYTPTNVYSSNNSYAYTAGPLPGYGDIQLGITFGDDEVHKLGDYKSETARTTEGYWTAGGSTDVWGYSFFTPEFINSSEFGIIVNDDDTGMDVLPTLIVSDFSFNIPANARIDGIKVEMEYYYYSDRLSGGLRIDHIRVTVDYTTATVVTSEIGTDGDYTTIAAWESAKQGNFVSNTHIQKGVLIDAKDYNESVTFDGSTCDRGFYWWLTAASDVRHDGTEHTSCARIERSSSGNPLKSSDGKFVAEWLLLQLHDGVATSDECIRDNNSSTTLTYLEVRNCIVTCDADASVTTYNQTDGIYTTYGNVDVLVENCIVYGLNRGGIHAQMYTFSGRTQNWHIRNTTVDHCGYGLNAQENANLVFRNQGDEHTINVQLYNVVSADAVYGRNYDDYAGSANWSGSNNATGSPGMPDYARTNEVNYIISADEYDTVTAGSQDYHLKDTDADLYDAGIDLSMFFTNDIDGGTRTRWDIGADEYGIPAASTGWDISIFGTMDDPTKVIGVANANIVKVTGITV